MELTGEDWHPQSIRASWGSRSSPVSSGFLGGCPVPGKGCDVDPGLGDTDLLVSSPPSSACILPETAM